MMVRQTAEQLSQPSPIFDQSQRPSRVHHSIVPSGHHFACLALGRIPTRRDISVRPLKYGQSILFTRQLPPEGVCTSYVSTQCTERTRIRLKLEWNVIRIETARSQGHKSREWMRAHQLM